MHNYHYILFDQDGTLTDSMPGIVRCVKEALAHFNIQETNHQNLIRFIGPPLRDSFRDFYHFTPAQTEEAVTVYNKHYNSSGLFENTVYTGIEELLAALKSDGYKLFVATSKPTDLAERILEHFDLRKWFDFVGGAEPLGSRNTKARVIEHVLLQNGITERSQAVMIGDRKHDIIGANAAGLDSIGVLWGYGDKAELMEHEATHIVKYVSDLKKLLRCDTPDSE